MVSPQDPYTGNGCSWRPGWRCAPSYRLSVKSHLRNERDTIRMSQWRQISMIFLRVNWRISYCMKSGLCFCAPFHPVWSPSRSCSYLWMSEGECTSSGSPSWSQPAATGWEPFPPEGIPGERQAGAPARRPLPGFFCLRPLEQNRWELLEVFRCSVVPKLGDSSYLKPPECHSCSHPLRKK